LKEVIHRSKLSNYKTVAKNCPSLFVYKLVNR
jgi:hypothetical protein